MDTNFLRHGDCNFHPVTETEYNQFTGKIKQHTGNYIVARGEATGSTHNVLVNSPTDLEIKEDGEVRMVKLLKEAKVSHTHDHETIIMKPGFYIQVPEREVDWFSKGVTRQVVD